MIAPDIFCRTLLDSQIDFFCGVPDSLLANLCAYIDERFEPTQHVIAANEGNAVAIAMGRYMATGCAAAVYMQNSGLGNTVNPLTSLADPLVYGIPMLLIVGWRGEPGVKDEPQHIKQGAITEQQLDLLNIPYVVMDANNDLTSCLSPLLIKMQQESRPVAVLVKKGTFAEVASQAAQPQSYKLKREAALKVLLEQMAADYIVVSTTGKTSRELFELRKSRGETPSDFLTVGGMGHTSSIAMGVAMGKPDKHVVAIDGDGSMLMHLGALPIIGNHNVTNLTHVLLNNSCHESVGGQPTVAEKLDIKAIALASGYSKYQLATDQQSIETAFKALKVVNGPTLLEIKISKGSRADLGRPTSTPIENKNVFMRHVENA